MNNIFRGVILFGILYSVTSCMVGRNYVSPELNLPETLQEEQPGDSQTLADVAWWNFYTDSTLQKLINRMLQHNKELLAAHSKVQEQAYLKWITSANFFPEIGVSVGAEREVENYGGDAPNPDNTLMAQGYLKWELDLWGNLRWKHRQGIAEYLQSVEAQRALQMLLVSKVATSYYELIALDNELAIVQQTLSTREEGVRQAKLRFEGGLTSETSYQQAQVELAKTATLIPQLEQQISAKENEISLLCGSYPSAIERGHLDPDILLPKHLPVGLPSTLLKRRPDLRAAEQQLIAAHAQMEVAYTDRFPKLTLTGRYGLENDALSAFLKSPYSFLSGELLTPLFSGRKLRARYRAAQAVYEQQTYAFQQSVLTAFAEVNDAIVAYNKIRESCELKYRLEVAAKNYVDLARLQYLNGVISYLDVLDAQRGYFEAQIGLSNAIRDGQIALVRLYKALGGGWQQTYPVENESTDAESTVSLSREE